MNARAAFENARRTDLYTTIHKALRAQLCDALVAAGRMDPQEEADSAEVLARVRLTIELARHHLHHENRHVHPLLEGRARGSASGSVREHAEHEEALERLESCVRALERSHGEAREAASLDLYRELALFAAENFRHMHAEETANNEALWRNYSDPELRQAHDAIIASADPRMLTECLRWLLAALSPAERAAMLSGLRGGMPPDAFLGVVDLAQELLGAREWARLLKALGTRPLAA